jgi:virginiamycin A acetyltransferase
VSSREYLRDAATALFVGMTMPLWGCVQLLGHGPTGMSLFTTCGQLLSLIPGMVGVFARRAFYVMTLEDCAGDVGIGFGTWFSKRKVRIARKVSIGAHCLVGSCSIGEGALLGSNIDILSGRRQHGTPGPDSQISAQKATFTPVNIGANVWIGNRVVIMADIGHNTIIGAGSVVVHAIASNVTAVGNPAKACRSSKDVEQG